MKNLTAQQIKIFKGSAIVLGLAGLGVGIFYGIKAYKKWKIQNNSTENNLDNPVVTTDLSVLKDNEVVTLQQLINAEYAKYPDSFNKASFKHLPIIVDGLKGADTIAGQKAMQIRKSKMELAQGVESPYKGDLAKDVNAPEISDNSLLSDFLPTWFK